MPPMSEENEGKTLFVFLNFSKKRFYFDIRLGKFGKLSGRIFFL